MIAGLLFATVEAADRPDMLAATLPIGGMTLIEFQARLLSAAGASQIVIVVSRLTPELLGAVNRLTRRGVAVDTVRTPAEAIAKLHPLARIVWLADGLVTTGAVVQAMAAREHDTLLVSPEGDALERVGPDAIWAGVATIDPQRIADVAKLPPDYDFASSLLRATAQRGADQIPLPDVAAREGHGVQRDSRALAARGRAALVAALGARVNWVDRLLIAPLAKLALPPLVRRGVPAVSLLGAGLAVGLGGLVGLALNWPVLGLVTVLVALAVLALSDVLGWLRDEQRLARVVRWAVPMLVTLALLLFGYEASQDAGTAVATTLAVTAVGAGALAERAAGAAGRRSWWAVPPAYPLLLLPFAILAQPVAGLAIVAVYAGATLAAAIERLRVRAG